MIATKKQKERGILVGVGRKSQEDPQITEMMKELKFIAKTLNIETSKEFYQRMEHSNTKTFVGKGKLEEIQSYVNAEKIEVAIFDDDLSPSQLRNIEKILGCKIYDRSLIILDVFLKRAKTAQAKTQVELARFQYLLPRLTRMWTHLERQRGGTGTRGGAGEKEIETDRRIIRDQISVLKSRLKKIEKQSKTQRKSRSGILRVALVGYTNAGKSTLMRLFSKENVYVKNELFATLDSTVRKVIFGDQVFLLSDTVGFIRKLPHSLIESFRSTLAEVREADFLLHVIDISNPFYEDHIGVVEKTLEEIHAGDIPVIKVFNKVDQLPEDQPINNSKSISISAEKNIRINILKKRMSKILKLLSKNKYSY